MSSRDWPPEGRSSLQQPAYSDPSAERIERMYKMLEEQLGRSLTLEEKRLVALADRYFPTEDGDSDGGQVKATG